MKIVLFYSFLLANSVTCQIVDYQPPELVSENGLLDVTLNISLVDSLEGIPWSETGVRTAPGYNGLPVGPTLRLKPGDTLTVTLNNNLDPSPQLDRDLDAYVRDPASDDANVTTIYNRLSAIGNVYDPQYGFWGLNFNNIHFHGMQFSTKEEALWSHVDGGESRTLTFSVPEDKEPGLYWYHNHVHGVASYSYMSSLMGLIVVEGDDETDLTKAVGVEGAKEVLLMLSEGLVTPDGSVPPFFPIVMQFNWTGVTNGHIGNQTQYTIAQGERILFRAASATVEPTLRLSIEGVSFVILAQDGIVLPQPIETDVVDIGGGGRVEFLARFDSPGEFVMKRASWRSSLEPTVEACVAQFNIPLYPCISYDKEEIITTVVVTETPDFVPGTEPLVDSIELPPVSDRLVALAAQDPVTTQTVILQQAFGFPLFQIPYDGPFVPPGTAFGINGRILTPTTVAGNVTANTCETWEVIADPPGTEHAFHVHAAHFLVLAQDGVPVENPRWADTEIIYNGNITIHVCFDRMEEADVLVVHCHAPSHFDLGMGAFYYVFGNNEESTDTPPDSTTETPPESTTDTPPDSTTEVPPESTTDTPPESTTEVPPESTTDTPPDSTTETPTESTEEPNTSGATTAASFFVWALVFALANL